MQNLNFIALDFETANSSRDSICEIGISIVSNSKIIETKSWLVKPEGNYYDSFNTFIHGINANDTKDAPLFPEIWKELKCILENKTIVAHNTSFDMYALRGVLELYNVEYPSFDYFCSYRLARYIAPGYSSYSLPNICKALNIAMGNHHRAGNDAEACANVFMKLLHIANIECMDKLESEFVFQRGMFRPDLFRAQLSTKSHEKGKYKASSIIGDSSKIDEANYFYGKTVCFTGKFSFGIRSELQQRIADIGGIPIDAVIASTNILVVGLQDFRIVGDDGLSSKQEKAIKMIEKGIDIEIMSESEFLQCF